VFTPVSYDNKVIRETAIVRCCVAGAKYRERLGVPGNSVSDTGDRINGGAVIDDRSPENDAIL
jgi:hypothetical protein